MKFRFTFSSEDGNQTKDFDNLPDAEQYMNDYITGVEMWSQTTFFPYDSHTSYRLFKDRKGRVIKIDKLESDNPIDQIIRDNEGNIIAGRQRAKVRKEFKPGQTIDKDSCLETTMNSIISDVRDIAEIEYQALKTIMNASIVFVDSNGNQYEYDGVCISEGKLKIAIKSNKPIKPTQQIQRKYFNFENQKTIDLLPFNQDTLEKIRLERECMEKDVEGSIMNRSEIWHYLSEGFTITTYQADYVIEGHEFCYDE